MDISNIFNSVLDISLVSSVIGVVIILLRQVLKNRVNSKWIYFIWFILLFKLLVPINIQSVVSIFNFTPGYVVDNHYVENLNIEYENLQQDYESIISQNMDKEILNFEDTEIVELDKVENALKSYKTKKYILEYVLPIIWVVGCILMLLWITVTNVILSLKLRKNNFKDERLEKILEKCKTKINVNAKLHLVVSNVVSTPAIVGIFKVKILIPKEILDLSDENIEYILLHELSHYKRKDIWINYILILIQSIHWFNPIIWLCFKLIRNDLELATDEYTLKYLEENRYESYANALIETLKVSKRANIVPSMIGMIDNKENIKRRIIMIKSLEIFKRKKVVITIFCICIIILFSVLLLTIPKKSEVKDELDNLESSQNQKNEEINNDENEFIEEDLTEKIAKLNTLSDFNEEKMNYNRNFVKDLSEKEIENIDRIYQNGEHSLYTAGWHNLPDFVIDFNDGVRNRLDIRIAKNDTILIEEYGNSVSIHIIYAEEDVSYILKLLGKENKYKNLEEIDLTKYTSPLDMYWYNTKLELGNYTWSTSANDNIGNIVNVDSVLPQEILKNTELHDWGSDGIIVGINKINEIKNKLPNETVVKYKVYESDENGANIEYMEAKKMINGLYYLYDLPKIKGEYIVEVYLSFGKLSNNNAHYYLKYNI